MIAHIRYSVSAELNFYKTGGFIVDNQSIYNGYLDVGANYYHLGGQSGFYQSAGHRAVDDTLASMSVGQLVRVNDGVLTWATGEAMPGWVHGRTYPVIEIRSRNGVNELLLGDGLNSWVRQVDVVVVSPIKINDRITVNQNVQTWATGEAMPGWVHGRTYPVIEIRTRNGGVELLLGGGINSWIRQTDVTKQDEKEAEPMPIRINDRVTVNQNVPTWATGEGMPIWVHGRTYPVIEIRTRNGVTELLLGDGINSWIRQTDVRKVAESDVIGLNDRVRVNLGTQTWATGEGMPHWVHGRTYPVIEIRTRHHATELLLGDGINSWIRINDVTKV